MKYSMDEFQMYAPTVQRVAGRIKTAVEYGISEDQLIAALFYISKNACPSIPVLVHDYFMEEAMAKDLLGDSVQVLTEIEVANLLALPQVLDSE